MVKISRTAAKMIKEAAKEASLDNFYLRIYIENFIPRLDLEETKRSTDKQWKKRGIKILIDKKTNEILKGKVDIDWQESLKETGFTVNSPALQSFCSSCPGDVGCCS